jgi:protoporphyrinogen oxidase
MSDVVVIGAGLTAAYELAKLGLTATLLEADSQVGGLARTVTYRSYPFDIGGHRFFSKVSLVNDLGAECKIWSMIGYATWVRRRLDFLRELYAAEIITIVDQATQ